MTVATLETLELLDYHRHGDRTLRDRLVTQHLTLVRQVAGSFLRSSRADLDDLLQVGAIGLLKAIDRFDPTLGHDFTHYATSLIAGEIRHYLRDCQPLIRPPRELLELRGCLKQACSDILSREGREGTVQELAEASGLSQGKVEEILAFEQMGTPVSLDAEPEEGSPLGHQLSCPRHRSFQLAQEDRIMLAQAMDKLRSVSREVIEFAFYQDLSQTEIARILGISQMQVSRRLQGALKELWKTLNQRIF